MRAVIIGNGDIKDYQYIKSKINDNDFFSVHELSSYFPSNYNNVHYT